jgi:hypothetical protein
MKRTVWIIMHEYQAVAATLDPFEAEELLALWKGTVTKPDFVYLTSTKMEINEQ